MTPPPTDAQRFEQLYRAQYPAIVRFVHRRIDPASAEEIVADTFAIAWRRFEDVPREPLPWLYGVARNRLRAERRALTTAHDKAASAARLASLGRDPADALAERDHALRAFAALSEGDREVLRLIAWEGLDHRAGARVLGISRVGFTMRVSRARRRLAHALSELDPPSLGRSPITSMPERQT